MTDPRVRVVVLERNSGVAVARNVGVIQATAPLVAFLDHDDTWLPAKLASCACMPNVPVRSAMLRPY